VYHAPPRFLARMRESLNKKNKPGKLLKEFQERWWLYKFTSAENASRICFNSLRDSKELENMEMIFFEEGETPDGKAVKLAFHPPVSGKRTDFTLGDLLNEAEVDSLRKFNTFRKTVQQFSGVGLNCDDYAGVPLFFCGSEQEYVTDIYVAFKHDREDGKIVYALKADEIIRILDDIMPYLKTCVSLINSQVAYSLGEVSRRDKMTNLLRAVIRHDINNFAAVMDGSMSQLLEYWRIMEEEDIFTILKEMRAILALYTMSIDLDFIWGPDRENLRCGLIALEEVQEELDKSWRLSTVTGCDFSGDWTKNLLVPKVCRIVLSNLLRNAIDKNEESGIIMDCQVKPDKISFGCLSEAPISDFWKRRGFEKPVSYKVPSRNLGLWICRHIIKSLKGEFYLAPSRENHKTHVRFDIPNLASQRD